MNIQTRQVGALQFSVSTPDQAVQSIIEVAAAKMDHGLPIHFANAYSVSIAESNSAYKNTLNLNGVTHADGKPISWISRIVGHNPAIRQIRGPRTFEAVIDQGQLHGIRHYLLGSTAEVLDRLESNLINRYPDALIVGKFSPPFATPSVEELRERDLRIRDSRAQIVWVGLGTPQQDFEVVRLASSLPIVAIAVGAAFDFSAGFKPTAPPWMTVVGLEWLFRLVSEPRRLWRRYLFGNLLFLKSCWLNRALSKGQE